MPRKEKTTKREQLTDLVLEFLEVSVHQFLYVWKIYPSESFTKRVIYDVPVYMSRHPQLWELEKLQVVLLAENGVILRRLSVETGWNSVVAQASSGVEGNGSRSWEQSDEPLPLTRIKEEFRAAIVALTATPITYGYNPQSTACAPPASFRLLAHTSEDASRSGTTLNVEEPANSWVYADRYWNDNSLEEQKSSTDMINALLPITSIQDEQLPLRMQMYVEDR